MRKTFEQLQSQHQRKSPEFSDIQWRDRLKRAQKSPDNFGLQRSVGFGDHFRGNLINPGQSCTWAAGDQRQLSIVFLRKTLAQIGHLFANQIGVIEQPLRRKREGVVRLSRHGETHVRPFQRVLDFE